MWDELKRKGDLYEASYRGYYCRSDEAFLTASQIYEDASGQKLSREPQSRGTRRGAQLDVPVPRFHD